MRTVLSWHHEEVDQRENDRRNNREDQSDPERSPPVNNLLVSGEVWLHEVDDSSQDEPVDEDNENESSECCVRLIHVFDPVKF